MCENDLNSAGGPIYFQFSRITIKKDSLVMFPFGEIKANIVGEKKDRNSFSVMCHNYRMTYFR